MPPTGSPKQLLRVRDGTWRGPSPEEAPAVRSPVSSTGTHLPWADLLARFIFAWLGISVEIKRLFAVTNVANSDQAI